MPKKNTPQSAGLKAAWTQYDKAFKVHRQARKRLLEAEASVMAQTAAVAAVDALGLGPDLAPKKRTTRKKAAK